MFITKREDEIILSHLYMSLYIVRKQLLFLSSLWLFLTMCFCHFFKSNLGGVYRAQQAYKEKGAVIYCHTFFFDEISNCRR